MAAAGPCRSSVVTTRKYVTLPVGRYVAILSLSPLQPTAAEFCVRQGLVLDGLIRASGILLAMGISARATLLLKGPTAPTIRASPCIAVILLAPFCGSCTPPTPTSSKGVNCSVTLGMVLFAFA